MTRPPILAVSNAELAGQPIVEMGDEIDCGRCGEDHELTVVFSTGLMSYQCGDQWLLGGIDGRLLPGLELVGEGR